MNNPIPENSPDNQLTKIAKKAKHSPYLVAAMLKIHGPRCTYTKRMIDPANVELDHILPREGFWEDRRQLAATINHYGLPDSFDPNGVENLLPVCRGANRAKSDIPYDESSNRYFLNEARKYRDRILEAEKRFLANKYNRKLFINLHKLHYKNPADFNQAISNLENECAVTRPDYESESQIRYERQYVTLSSLPPNINISPPGLSMTALVILSRFTLREALITLDTKDILQSLLCGIGLPALPQARPWIIGDHVDNPTLMCIQVGGTRCFVQHVAAAELAETADKLSTVLYHRTIQIEELCGTLDFEPMQGSQFRLFRISWELWQLLLTFAAEHDFTKGHSNWHVFNAHNNLRIATSSCPSPKIGLTKRCTIWPSPARDYESILQSRDEVWLCWRLADFEWNPETKNTFTMTAAETAAWIQHKLIPAAIAWHNTPRPPQKRSFFRRFLASPLQAHASVVEAMPQLVKSNGYHAITPKSNLQPFDALKILNELQYFFNVHAVGFRLKSDMLNPVLDGIEKLAARHPERVTDYMLGNLQRGHSTSLTGCIRIQRHLLQSNPTVGGDTADYMLRALCELCGDSRGNAEIPDNEILEVVMHMEALIAIRDRELYRKRMLCF